MSNNGRFGTITGLILGPLFAIVGYFVAFTFGKPILDNAKRSVDWPSVSGVVTQSALETSRSKGKTMYSFDVGYRYQVEGKEYACSNVYFGGAASSSSSSSAKKVIAKYPQGAKVQVHYEPGNPANGVLEPGARMESYAVYGIGMTFLVVGAIIFSGSLFYVLLFGAVAGGVAAAWFRGSASSGSGERFAPEYSPDDRFAPSEKKPPASPRTEANDNGGFEIR